MQNRALNRNKASAQRIFPFWSACDAAGREGGGPEDCGGTAARSGRVNPSLCFGGRPACLQLCFLRPCESSQAEPEELLLERRSTKRPSHMPKRREQGGVGGENRSVQSGRVFFLLLSLCFVLLFFLPPILLTWHSRWNISCILIRWVQLTHPFGKEPRESVCEEEAKFGK